MSKRPSYRQRESIRRRLKAIGAPCAICGKPIDYDLDWWIDPKDGKKKRHPMSFEYDHIVALADGGDKSSFGNAQAAHRICNQAKSGGAGKRACFGVPASRRDKRYYANGVPIEKSTPTSRAW